MFDREGRMKAEDQEQISKLLRSKRCDLWPDRGCNETLVHWQDKLENDDKSSSSDQPRWTEWVIFINPSCGATRCPERKIKTWATIQLLNPFCDKQKEETIEGRRQHNKSLVGR